MDTIDKDRLYKLLPYIYQLRDSAQGSPLRALLQVISEQVGTVEQDIGQLYDNWFIETCADWLVPYIGDLVGYTPVHEAGLPGANDSLQGRLRNKALIPRREVANTVRYRRRKGSLALLELLANDVADWPARAVEFYKLLGVTQALKHYQKPACHGLGGSYYRSARGLTADLRCQHALDRLNGPFDVMAHTVDVRRINSQLSQGRYNLPSIGLFVWRLKAYAVTETPITALEQRNCYTFSVLGNNTPLFTKVVAGAGPTAIAGELDLPIAISRYAFSDADGRASAAYYGQDKSLAIWAPDWPSKDAIQPIPRDKVVPADLSDWGAYRPVKDTVAVDPVLGRILFPPKQAPKKGVRVSYHYGFSADMGGGEYARKLAQVPGSQVYKVGGTGFTSINAALAQWQQECKNQVSTVLNAVVEITDSGLYEEQLKIDLSAGQTLQIRAANHKRPILNLADRPDQFSVTGGKGGYLVLDGLLIAGRGLQIEGEVAGVVIRHSTLVPGWTLKADCEPSQLEEPSIDISNASTCLTIQHSIVGSIQVNIDEVGLDPVAIRISDSIVDATGTDCDGLACEAIGAASTGFAHVVLSIIRSTVFGHMDVHAIALAENSLLLGSVRVARRQLGCMRFCYVKPGSRTPKRYQCQPDLAAQQAENELRRSAAEANLPPDITAINALRLLAEQRVIPQFNSRRYGTPSYSQLAENCAEEISRGADDESEMGVFHDLFQPQRQANLKVRLDEYIPARADVGIVLAS